MHKNSRPREKVLLKAAWNQVTVLWAINFWEETFAGKIDVESLIESETHVISVLLPDIYMCLCKIRTLKIMGQALSCKIQPICAWDQGDFCLWVMAVLEQGDAEMGLWLYAGTEEAMELLRGLATSEP